MLLEGLISSLKNMCDTTILGQNTTILGKTPRSTSTQCMTSLASFNSENPELPHLVCIAYRKYPLVICYIAIENGH